MLVFAVAVSAWAGEIEDEKEEESARAWVLARPCTVEAAVMTLSNHQGQYLQACTLPLTQTQ